MYADIVISNAFILNKHFFSVGHVTHSADRVVTPHDNFKNSC